MDPPDSTETNLSLKSKILDEKSRTDVIANLDFGEYFDEYLMSISSDCKYSGVEKDHESNDGYGFNFSQDIKKEDSNSLTSDSCVPRPCVPVISEVSTMIEKLKEQNKEMRDKNTKQEMELARYEEKLSKEMDNLLKIQMERNALKENLTAAENARANLEVKLAEKEAELKQFKELAQKSLHDSNELQQLRKDLNTATKLHKKADKDLVAAQAFLNKKNLCLRKLRCSNRKLLAAALEFGSILENKGLLTQKQLKYLKTVKEESSTENLISETNCEIKENGSFDTDRDGIQNNQLNGYNEISTFNSDTLISNEVKIKTEGDYNLQDSFCNGVAGESNYIALDMDYSHNRETQNSSVNGEGIHSHCDDESSLKPHCISNLSEVATSTLNSNHLLTYKNPLDLLNRNVPVKYCTDSSHNAVNINTDYLKKNMLSSNVENVQNNSSVFHKSNKLSPDSNFVPIGAPKSESVCSEDFMDVSDDDFAAMKQQVWCKCDRLSPLPPTPPPSQYKTKIFNSVKVENQSSIHSALPPLTSSKDNKMPPKALDKRNTLFHQTSRGFEPQIDEPAIKQILPLNENPVSASENTSDLTLPSNLYYVSAQQVNNSFLIDGFGNGHLEYLLDFRNGHSVLAITPNDSESTALNQTNVNVSANSQGSPSIHANRRLSLLLSHYESYNKQMLSNSQNSISLQGQASASQVSEKLLQSTPIQPKTKLEPDLPDPCKFQNSSSAFSNPQKEIKSLSEEENGLSKFKAEADNQFFVSSSCDSSTPTKRKLKHSLNTSENMQKNTCKEKLNKANKSHSPIKIKCETSQIRLFKENETSQNILETELNMQECGIDIKRVENSQTVLNLSSCSKLPSVCDLASEKIQTQAQSDLSLCGITQVKSECTLGKESVTASLPKISTEIEDTNKEMIETSNKCNSQELASSTKDMPVPKSVDSDITKKNLLHVNRIEPDSKTKNIVYPFVINQSSTEQLESSNKNSNLKENKIQIKRQRTVQFHEINNIANTVSPMEVVIPNSTGVLNLNPSDSADVCFKKMHKSSKKKLKLELKPTTNEVNGFTSPSVITNSDISHMLNDAEKHSPEKPMLKSKFTYRDDSKVLSNILSPRKIENELGTGYCGVNSKSVCTLPSTSIVREPKCNNAPLSKKIKTHSLIQTHNKNANFPSTKNNVNKIIKAKKSLAVKSKRKNKKQRNKQKGLSTMSKINHSGNDNSAVKNLSLIKFVRATEIENESEIKQQFQNADSKFSVSVVNGNFDSIQAANEQNTLLNQHNAPTEDINPNGSFIHIEKPIQSITEATSNNCILVTAEVHCSIEKSHEDKKDFSSALLDTSNLPNEDKSIKDSPLKEKINSRTLPLSPGLFAVNAESKVSSLPYITFKNGRASSSPTKHVLDSILSPVKEETSHLNLSSSVVNGNSVESIEQVCSPPSPMLSPKVSNLGQDSTPKRNDCNEVLNNKDIVSPCSVMSSPSQHSYLKQDSGQTIHMNGDSYSHIQRINSNAEQTICHSSTISDDEQALIIAEDFDDVICTPQEEEGFKTQNTNNAVGSTPKKKKKCKKNKKSANLGKNAQKRPKLIKEEPADSSLTISKAFEEIEKLKFDDSHFKLRVHTLVNALINPANASDTISVLFYVIQYLSSSRRNPLMTFTISLDSTALLPQLEKCIVRSLIQVEHKMKNHLKGLLSSAIKSLYLLVLAKDCVPIYGLCAFCRVFTEICKFTEDSKKPIMLCCDLLKMKHKFAPYLIASIIGVWPKVFAVSDGTSGVELMYNQSIVYGVEKKPQSLTDTQWKHCHSIFSKFLTAPTRNVIRATNDLMEMIESTLEEECFEEEYMLTDPLVIFSAYEGWKWAHENLLINFVLPNLAKYAQKEENKKAFNLFCTLYSEIALLSPDSSEPIQILWQFFLLSEAQEYVKPIAARSLLKLFLKDQSIPGYLSTWIQENESILTKPIIEELLRRRIMTDTPELTEEDIVSV